MPALSNKRHELFAHGLAKGLLPEEAYVRAGFKAHRQNAHRMMTNDDIRARVDELMGKATEKLVVDRAWVLSQLVDRAKRYESEAPASSLRAIELLGKEMGMFVERSESVNANYHISADPMDENGWLEEYASEEPTGRVN